MPTRNSCFDDYIINSLRKNTPAVNGTNSKNILPQKQPHLKITPHT